jgi:hypothetical protein
MKYSSLFFILLTALSSNAYASSNEAKQAAQTKSWVAAHMAGDLIINIQGEDTPKLKELRGYYQRRCMNEEEAQRMLAINKKLYFEQKKVCDEIREFLLEAERQRGNLQYWS